MGVITPDSFDLFISIYLLIYTVVGGSKKFAGAVVGLLGLTLIPEVSRVLKEYQPFVFVAVLYGVVFLLREGFLSCSSELSMRIWRHTSARNQGKCLKRGSLPRILRAFARLMIWTCLSPPRR